jgi:thiamine-phosphate pyrophosphorylase
VRAYLEGGARVIQLRAKTLPSAAFLALCDDAVRAAEASGARLIVNDRVDLARLSRAAGVHVGQEDVPPRDARAQLGPAAIVGFSTHTVEQIAAAAREPVTYIAVGPVFGTTTKATGYEAVGLDLVRAAVARAGGLPIVAIGGITLDRAPEVLASGASAVAVIGDLLSGGDPASRVAAYCRSLM